MSTNAPVEGKVWGATVGTGAGATVATFIIWLLGVIVWKASASAETATDAIAAVPFPVIGMIGLLITVGGAFVGGYLAKHTPRPEPTPRRALVEEQGGVVEYGEEINFVESQPTHYPVPEYANVRDTVGEEFVDEHRGD